MTDQQTVTQLEQDADPAGRLENFVGQLHELATSDPIVHQWMLFHVLHHWPLEECLAGMALHLARLHADTQGRLLDCMRHLPPQSMIKP